MCSPRLKRLCYVLAILIGVLLVAHLLMPSRTHPYLYRDRFITVFNSDNDGNATSSFGPDDLTHLLDLRNFNYTLQPTQSACTPDSGDQLLGSIL